jgi:hypothetical protein
MDPNVRRRGIVFAAPMLIALISAQRAAPHVRTVDFLLLFGSGVLFGVCLMNLIRFLRGGSRG